MVEGGCGRRGFGSKRLREEQEATSRFALVPDKEPPPAVKYSIEVDGVWPEEICQEEVGCRK